VRRASATLLVALACGGCATFAHRERQVVRDALASTVQLHAERVAGGRRAASGVVLAADAMPPRAWVITTKHFVDPSGMRSISARLPGKTKRWDAAIVATSAHSDLVLLEVPGLFAPGVRLSERTRLGDEVRVVGFPWGGRLTLVSGIVSQLAADSPDFTGVPRMVDASVSYGASGGGVFDATAGALIGIVEGYRTARVSLHDAPDRVVDLPVAGETTIVPASEIIEFLRAAGFTRLIDWGP
jgi:S1-C subfamily serine protease